MRGRWDYTLGACDCSEGWVWRGGPVTASRGRWGIACVAYWITCMAYCITCVDDVCTCPPTCQFLGPGRP